MSERITGLDHVLVGVRDLAAARRAWQRLGFTASPRGRHIGWGTANYCLMFERDYIELLGILDPGQFTNNLDRFLAEREGLLGLAFACDDAAALAENLRGRGIAAEGPKALARIIELDGGEARPAFELVHLPAEASAGLRAFACRHRTPELVWREAWTRHANGARAIRALTAVAEDPAAAAAALAVLLDAEPVRSGEGRVDLRCGDCTLGICTPAALAEAYGPAAVALGGPATPWLAGLTLAVADLGRTAACLTAAGVAYARSPQGALRVPPEEANGLILEFVAEGRPR